MIRLLQTIPTALSLLITVSAYATGKAPNILLICVDDLRPELGCYGADYIRSPHIDRLASEGLLFERHYVQAPSCGPSRYTLLTGIYGSASNDALFRRAEIMAEHPESVSPSMPTWFRKHGYETVSIGKVSHHPGGHGGTDWNDGADPEMPRSWDRSLMPSGAWQHPRGAMHGLANGEIRIKVGGMDVFQSVEGPDSVYPDGLITETALEELQSLASGGKPFLLAVGLIRPHLPLGAPAKYMEPYLDGKLPAIAHPEKPQGRTTWHRSGEFMKYNRWGRDPNADAAFADEVRRHYAACVTYADAQVGRLLDELIKLDIDDDTIVILWGDHGWHLGEHAIWGKHALFEESLHSPLIIRKPGKIGSGQRTEAIVETVDIFPTLCELAELPIPEFLNGESVLRLIGNTITPCNGAVSYTNSAITLRTDTHRLIVHTDGYAELYNHASPEKETLNIAETNQELTIEMAMRLRERMTADITVKVRKGVSTLLDDSSKPND